MQDNKIIRLVEERGYAMSQYKHVIKKIISYCQKYITNDYEKHTSEYEIEIPKNITQLIDIVSDLNIIINITNYNKDFDNIKYASGSGSASVILSNYIDENNKLNKYQIIVNGISYNGIILEKTLFSNLSHEFNHLYLEYKHLLKNGNNVKYYIDTRNKLISKNTKFSEIPQFNNYLKTIFYRLLDYSELNALINSVYGDLAGINSERDNFHIDIKNTAAYYIYKSINNYFDDFCKVLDVDDWNVIKKAYYNMSNHRDNNLNAFKTYFIRLVKLRLTELINGIGKVASYYYDTKDDLELMESLKNDEMIYI